MKPKIITSFAIIGILFLILKVATFFIHEGITAKYWENCKKVKPGMTLAEARKIIGDVDFQYWTQDDKSGEIIIRKASNGNVTYTLEYDMVFAGSDNPKIYFDPNTLIVTEVFSGE